MHLTQQQPIQTHQPESHPIPLQQLQPMSMQQLNTRTDVNFSIESIFASAQQMPQLSFVDEQHIPQKAQSSPSPGLQQRVHSTSTIAQPATMSPPLTNAVAVAAAPASAPRSKFKPIPPKLDFSSFNINFNEPLPACGDSAAPRCCKNPLPDTQSEINTPTNVKLANPFDSQQQQQQQCTRRTQQQQPPQQQQSVAVEMAMASEVEMPAAWIDVGVLAAKAVSPHAIADPVAACVALPTAIPTYVDLPAAYLQMATASPTERQNNEYQQQQKPHSNQDDIIDVDTLVSDAHQQMDMMDDATAVAEADQASYSNGILGAGHHMLSATASAQQLEADNILNEILRSIDSVHQATAQMAEQAALGQAAFKPVPVLLPHLAAPYGVAGQYAPSQQQYHHQYQQSQSPLQQTQQTYHPAQPIATEHRSSPLLQSQHHQKRHHQAGCTATTTMVPPEASAPSAPPTRSLERITADADICSCGVNCACDQTVGCQGGCGTGNPCGGGAGGSSAHRMEVDVAGAPRQQLQPIPALRKSSPVKMLRPMSAGGNSKPKKAPLSGGCCGGGSCDSMSSTPSAAVSAAPPKHAHVVQPGVKINLKRPVQQVRPKSLNMKEAQNLVSSLVTSSCCVAGGSVPPMRAVPPLAMTNSRPAKPSATGGGGGGCSKGGGCTCKSPMEGINNGCCVVICLKTLEQLRSMLNSSTINLIRCSGAGGGVA